MVVGLKNIIIEKENSVSNVMVSLLKIGIKNFTSILKKMELKLILKNLHLQFYLLDLRLNKH